MTYFHKLWQDALKTHMKLQGTQNSKNILKKTKVQIWEDPISWFRATFNCINICAQMFTIGLLIKEKKVEKKSKSQSNNKCIHRSDVPGQENMIQP